MQTKLKVRVLKQIPARHRVIETEFLVDAFWYRSPDVHHWFLTHFHSDHYGGLDAEFDNGWIYCTPATSRLVATNLKVSFDFLKILELNVPTVVAGVQVTALDANHCPGSAMLLFQHKSGLTILHSGDFRYHPTMQNYVLSNLDYLYLDTTYCNPKYKLPSQDKAIETITKIVRQNFQDQVLFLVGAYKIGKERIVIELAKEFKCKIYISAQRMNDLKCCEIENFDEIFTRNVLESRIHVVPMMHLSYKKLPQLEVKMGEKYTKIIAFKPTGWALASKKDVTTTSLGNVSLISVPYSEHSSYDELREFVKFTKPKKIVPTVNAQTQAETDKLLANFSDLMDSSRDKSKILYYFQKQAPPNDRKRKLEAKTTNQVIEKGTLTSSAKKGIWERFFKLKTDSFDLGSVDIEQQRRILNDIQVKDSKK